MPFNVHCAITATSTDVSSSLTRTILNPPKSERVKIRILNHCHNIRSPINSCSTDYIIMKAYNTEPIIRTPIGNIL